ncbi:phage baseplate assembly protein [Azotobacter chroococcum]|uniref:phage baseplate assembly protein n=1 Tax=Azotobacter chroococcum TaxID=353 RepID=UPI0010AEAE8F|nr:hypothetical protein [Azotobacter chroococcum]TKD40588.1 hypothetical protein FCG41_09650 [Azotobacter chroococcum]
MDDLELRVNGLSYAGWTELGVTRAMDAASSAFTVTLTERWEGRAGMAAQVEPWPGRSCRATPARYAWAACRW